MPNYFTKFQDLGFNVAEEVVVAEAEHAVARVPTHQRKMMFKTFDVTARFDTKAPAVHQLFAIYAGQDMGTSLVSHC